MDTPESKRTQMASVSTHPDQRYKVNAVDRAIDVLMLVATSESDLTLSEISEKTGLPAPTTLRLLRTLAIRNLVDHDPATGRYYLGIDTLKLSSAASNHFRIDSTRSGRPLYWPYLKSLRDSTNETATISIRKQFLRIPIARLESTKPVRQSSELGEGRPLYAGAASKVLLAGMEDDEIEQFLNWVDLKPLSPATPSSPHQVWEQVSIVRRLGYAVSYNERNNGGAAVAAPIRDSSGAVVASLHLSVPEFRLNGDLRTQCISAVTETAKALSATLGFMACEDEQAGL